MSIIKKIIFVLYVVLPCIGIEEMNNTRREIKKGQIYKHYKGNLYKVVAITVDTEKGIIDDYAKINDSQRRVVYYALDNEALLWDRPYEMFAEKTIIDGVEQYRFTEYEE